MVTDLMDTDAHQIIRSQQALSDQHVQYFLYQVLRGLLYSHSAQVVHRDLKPSNLLLCANCDLKIADFGLARISHSAALADDPSSLAFASEEEMTEYVATRWYRAPEIILGWRHYTGAVDVWSVGCILAEMLDRRPLLPGRDYVRQLHLIIDLCGTPTEADLEGVSSDKAKRYVLSLPHRPGVDFARRFPNANPQAVDLLKRMLEFNPRKRISVRDALAHPYLSQLHDPADEPTYTGPAIELGFETEPLTKEVLTEHFMRVAGSFHPEACARIGVPPQPTLEALRGRGADSEM
eukprot:gnl/Ergobibamus_cyprinoides/463.p1 GENE.gnl/Ergobibamus_cyprinoides/463~~gnl/Ergobibamus_cyprinoides/463.p1  ORF type:complete len:293 (+),score=77.85 gnl/Ergobibamus_cyprinoides/463:191-1069(+)